MTSEIAVALIGALPATLAALAAWRKVSLLAKPLTEQAQEGKTMAETVDCVAATVEQVAKTVSRVEVTLQAHQAWHQQQTERV